MRVIDFGQVGALRSQTVWHALCRAARPGDAPVLSFVRPSAAYLSLGYHRDVAEVDTGYCLAQGLPVLRRMVGGGPVLCDSDQLFFQVTVPTGDLPARRSTALSQLLEPAARALHRVGVDARLDRFGEISVGDAKVCGHGAGQIGAGAVVVGNLITAFDHRRAARTLRLHPEVRAEVLRLMRRHVAGTPVDPLRWQDAMVEEYGAHFGQPARGSEMTGREQDELARMDDLLGRPGFVAGDSRPAKPVRTVKIRAGVWVHDWCDGDERVVLSVAGGVVETATGTRGAGRLIGLPLARAQDELARDRRTTALAAAIGMANTEVSAA